MSSVICNHSNEGRQIFGRSNFNQNKIVSLVSSKGLFDPNNNCRNSCCSTLTKPDTTKQHRSAAGMWRHDWEKHIYKMLLCVTENVFYLNLEDMLESSSDRCNYSICLSIIVVIIFPPVVFVINIIAPSHSYMFPYSWTSLWIITHHPTHICVYTHL